MRYCRDTTPCQWGRVAAGMWAEHGCNISRWGGANAVATPVLEY